MVAAEVLNCRQLSHSFAGSRTSRNIPKCSAAKFELHICTNKTCKKQGSTEAGLSSLIPMHLGFLTEETFVILLTCPKCVNASN